MAENKKSPEEEKLSLDAPDTSLFPALQDGAEDGTLAPSTEKRNPTKDTFTRGLKGLVDPKSLLEADSSASSPNTEKSPLQPIQPTYLPLRLGLDGPVPTQGDLNAVHSPLTEIAPEPLTPFSALSGSWERWGGATFPNHRQIQPSSPRTTPQQNAQKVSSSGNYQTFSETVREQSRTLWEQAEHPSHVEPSSTHPSPTHPSSPHPSSTHPSGPVDSSASMNRAHSLSLQEGGITRSKGSSTAGTSPSSAMWPSADPLPPPDDGTFSAAFWAIVEDVPTAPDEERPPPASRVQASPYGGAEPKESHLYNLADSRDFGKRSPSGGYAILEQDETPLEDLSKPAISPHAKASWDNAFPVRSKTRPHTKQVDPPSDRPLDGASSLSDGPLDGASSLSDRPLDRNASLSDRPLDGASFLSERPLDGAASQHAEIAPSRQALQALAAKEREVQLLRSAQPTDEMPTFTLWPESDDPKPHRASPSSSMWPSLGDVTRSSPHSPASVFWSATEPEPATSQQTTLPSVKVPSDASLPELLLVDASELLDFSDASTPSDDSIDSGDSDISGDSTTSDASALSGDSEFLDFSDASDFLSHPDALGVSDGTDDPSLSDHTDFLDALASWEKPTERGSSMASAQRASREAVSESFAEASLRESAASVDRKARQSGGDTLEEPTVKDAPPIRPTPQEAKRKAMTDHFNAPTEHPPQDGARKRRATPSYADMDVVRKLQSMWMLPPELQAYEREDRVALGDTGIHPVVGQGAASHLAAPSAKTTSRVPSSELSVHVSPSEPKTGAEASEIALVVPVVQQKLPKLPEAELRRTVFPEHKKLATEDAILRRVRARYESIQMMSEDAMWQIELVRDLDLKRTVAIKRLKAEMHIPHAVLRMAEEVQIMAGLAHPNIPEIHDVGVDEQGRYYFVMEHLKGETMRSVIKKLASGDVRYQKRFPLQTRLFIFREVLRAVEYAHRKGVLHRNLNPAHVVVGARDEVKLLGWELAHKFQAIGQDPEPMGAEAMDAIFAPMEPIPGLVTSEVFRTRDGRIQGSPAYMAPEQIRNLAPLIDERSDVYGLASLFYEWIGLRYYLGAKKTLDDLSEGIVNEEPIPLHLLRSNLQPDLSVSIGQFATRALQKDPNQRFASVAEMRAALESLMVGGTIESRGKLPQALRFLEERPILMGSLLILFACTLILSGVQLATWLRAL